MGRIFKDLTGKKFGKWTVISRSKFERPTKDGNISWDCRCECGSTTVFQSKHLRAYAWKEREHGILTGCRNCTKLSRNGSENITGGVFGTWRVISYAGVVGEGSSRKSQWKCECLICGQKNLVIRGILSSGEIDGRGLPSCPSVVCQQDAQDTYIQEHDITGETYGELVVANVRFDPTAANNKSIIGICVCSCGMECEYTLVQLRNSGIDACDLCRARRYRQLGLQRRKSMFTTYLNHLRRGARIRNLDFAITEADIREIFTGKCAITGLPISLGDPAFRRDGAGSQYKNRNASVDRIDSSKGYTRENIQWVHVDINFMKQDMSIDNFIEMCKLAAQSK